MPSAALSEDFSPLTGQPEHWAKVEVAKEAIARTITAKVSRDFIEQLE